MSKIEYKKYKPTRSTLNLIEKDALAGVFQKVCNELDVPFFSCRGYTSQSEMHKAAQRLGSYYRQDKLQIPIVFHFGDHDPSGIDMSRDIQDRLNLFSSYYIEVRRIALNMEQIKEHQPPPNPAKTTDSRYKNYIEKYGHSSWELDALRPEALAELVRKNITELINQYEWDEVETQEKQERKTLELISENFQDIKEFIAQK